MIDGELMNEIREAAAQGKTSLHDEKVCEACAGQKVLPDCDDGCCTTPCTYCNGTGKEKAK